MGSFSGKGAKVESSDLSLFSSLNGLLIGSPRSGKASISNLFDAQDSFVHLNFSSTPIPCELSTLCSVQISPQQQIDFIIFVLDLQRDIQESTFSLCNLLHFLSKREKPVKFLVFLHKADGISNQVLLKAKQEIESVCLDIFTENPSPLHQQHKESIPKINLHFCTTSIYNDSVNIALGQLLECKRQHQNSQQQILIQAEHLRLLLKAVSEKFAYSQCALVDSNARIVISTYETDGEASSNWIGNAQIISLVDMHCDLNATSQASPSAKGNNTLWKVQQHWIYCTCFAPSLCFFAVSPREIETDLLEREMDAFSSFLFRMISGIEIKMKVISII